jgi:hypothetical protein
MYGSRRYASAAALSKKYSDEQIFSFYLGKSIEYGVQMLSPFRQEKKPSCHFFKDRNGRSLFVDFGEDKSFSPIDYVMRLYHLNYSEAVNRIWADMSKAKVPERVDLGEESEAIPKSYSSRKSIAVLSMDMTEVDLAFWAEFGVSSETLEFFNIFRVEMAWLDERLIYRYSASDPCYAYLLGRYKYKLYYPLRGLVSGDTRPRFITNAPEVIQGYAQLPESGKLLVITKSMKDAALLKEYGIPAIAPQAEGYEIPPEVMIELKLRFYHVISLYDFDLAGVRGAQYFRKTYQVPAFFLTNGRFNSKNYSAKDLTDFRKRLGEEATKALINWGLSLILEEDG